jgi:hypothetical protein
MILRVASARLRDGRSYRWPRAWLAPCVAGPVRGWRRQNVNARAGRAAGTRRHRTQFLGQRVESIGSPGQSGIPGGRPPGINDETTPVRKHRGRQSLVEVAGIEPASFSTSSGLLRAQPAVFFSAPAVTQASCRRAQSLFDVPPSPATGLDGRSS